MKFKLNFGMFKSKPVLWIVGGIVLFVIFYMVASRGAGNSGSSGVTVNSSGPSDAAISANVALQNATLQANVGIAQTNAALQAQQSQNATDLAIANLAAQNQTSQIQASADVAKLDIASSAAVQTKGLDVQQQIADMNGQYSLETARTASQTQLGIADIQAKMFTAQLDAAKFQTAVSSAAAIGGDSGVRALQAVLVVNNNPQGLPINNMGGNFGTGIVVPGGN